MNQDEPTDPELAAALSEAMTLWATPGLVDHSDHGPLALLALAPEIVVQTSDDHPGAELIDVVTSSLLGSGFGLLARLEPSELAELPVLDQWYAELELDRRVLRIIEPAGSFYDGDLGPQPPVGWHDALQRRGRLIVLFSSGVDSGGGGLVGAQLPLHVAPFWA